MSEFKECFFCHLPITKETGRDNESLTEHHINGNHNDDRPENKTFVHRKCHNSHHNKNNKHALGKRYGEETKNKVRLARLARGDSTYNYTEECRKIGLANKGRKHTEEELMKMKEKKKLYWERWHKRLEYRKDFGMYKGGT
jgi:hypothetical protein